MLKEPFSPSPDHTLTRLTALWALNESGLGGLMFALKIPLTGIFVGGFAVLLIALIAFYSNNDGRKVLRALVLVLIVKATASPHSPFPAYLAVAFQGLAGALLFTLIRNFRIAAVLLAVVAMAESALQKLILLTLVYGKSVWQALDKLYDGIAREFSLQAQVSASRWVIAAYLLFYIVWGVIVGAFAGGLPAKIETYASEALRLFREREPESVKLPAAKRRRRLRFGLLGLAGMLLFILLTFAFGGQEGGSKLLFILLRSIAAILLLFFVAGPLFRFLLQYWLKTRSGSVKEEAAGILVLLPRLRSFVRPAWEMAAPRKRAKLKFFVIYMLVLSLHER